MNSESIHITNRDIWKKDSATRTYIRKNRDRLNFPSRMDIHELADASTYCTSWENPYSLEIVRRSGFLADYESAGSRTKRRAIFEDACELHGIKLY